MHFTSDIKISLIYKNHKSNYLIKITNLLTLKIKTKIYITLVLLNVGSLSKTSLTNVTTDAYYMCKWMA